MSDLEHLTVPEIRAFSEGDTVILARALNTSRAANKQLREALTVVGMECETKGLGHLAQAAREALWPKDGGKDG